MFTNTIFASIIITLATNWTGHVRDGQELGYLVTNRTLVINDPCNLHERRGILYVGEMIELKAIPSDKLVWRTNQAATGNILISTSIWTNLPWFVWTNRNTLEFVQPISKCP